MAVPDEYITGSIGDVACRLNSGVIEYNRKPVIVNRILTSSRKTNIFDISYIEDLNKYQHIPSVYKSIFIDISKRLGYLNIDKDMVAHICKVPRRSMQQSLSSNNSRILLLSHEQRYNISFPVVRNIPGFIPTTVSRLKDTGVLGTTVYSDKMLRNHNRYNKIGKSLEIILYSDNFLNMFNNKYYNVLDIINNNHSPYFLAVDRRYILERDKHLGRVYLLHRHQRIGEFKGDKIKLIYGKEYLKEEIKSKFGVSTIGE